MPFLVGAWFGQGQPNDKSEMWLIHQSADGSFRVLFRKCLRGQALDQIETGRWSLAGDTETLQVQSVNGTPLAATEIYKILSHSGDEQVYRYLASGFVYTSHRVDGNFEMPSCQMVS